MPFPHYKNKHNKTPAISPNYFTKGNKINYKTVIFVYSHKILKYLKQALNAKRIHTSRRVFNSFGIYESKKYDILIVHLPIGAPVTASATDELISLGTKQFVILGLAGSLREDLTHGNIVLCSKSLRDEGASHHYIGPGTYALPTKRLKEKLETLMKKENINFYVGPSWTIDAPYMETVEEIKYYSKKGILTVEMESSAMFSVVNRRKREGYYVEAAAVFIISDIVAKNENEYHFIMSHSDYKRYKIKDRVEKMARVLKKL